MRKSANKSALSAGTKEQIMKDNFSSNSKQYKLFRPTYPSEVFDFILNKVSSFENAWDCGTGNGQIAAHLTKSFKTIYASDISEKQLEEAEKFENIHYSVQAAEKTNFPDNFFDLILVGQAIHWFDFKEFYEEVKRTGKKDALLVVLGYGKIQINKTLDKIIDKLYTDILGTYWDKERKYIDENYQTIPFPFEEISCPNFDNSYDWSLKQLLGYLETWSAVKHYIKQHQTNPIEDIKEELKLHWSENQTKKVHFPLLLRIGKINK